MGVYVTFECSGCDAKTPGTRRIKRKFTSFTGRSYGIGTASDDAVVDVTPDGWVAFDPYTYCTYCPKCWAEIEAHAAS